MSDSYFPDIHDIVEVAYWAICHDESEQFKEFDLTKVPSYFAWLVRTIWDVRKKSRNPTKKIQYEDVERP